MLNYVNHNMAIEESSGMNSPELCVTCNEEDGIMHHMRLHEPDDTSTDMELYLYLCDQCVNSFANVEWVELGAVEESNQRSH